MPVNSKFRDLQTLDSIIRELEADTKSAPRSLFNESAPIGKDAVQEQHILGLLLDSRKLEKPPYSGNTDPFLEEQRGGTHLALDELCTAVATDKGPVAQALRGTLYVNLLKAAVKVLKASEHHMPFLLRQAFIRLVMSMLFTRKYKSYSKLQSAVVIAGLLSKEELKEIETQAKQRLKINDHTQCVVHMASLLIQLGTTNPAVTKTVQVIAEHMQEGHVHKDLLPAVYKLIAEYVSAIIEQMTFSAAESDAESGAKITLLQHDLANAREEIEDAGVRIEELEATVEKQKTTVGSLQTTVESLRSQRSDSEKEIANLKKMLNRQHQPWGPQPQAPQAPQPWGGPHPWRGPQLRGPHPSGGPHPYRRDYRHGNQYGDGRDNSHSNGGAARDYAERRRRRAEESMGLPRSPRKDLWR